MIEIVLFPVSLRDLDVLIASCGLFTFSYLEVTNRLAHDFSESYVV